MAHDLGSPWGNPPFTIHHSADQDLNSQTSEPPKDPGPVRFAPRAAKAAARRGAAPAPAPRLPMSRRGSAPTLQTGSVWKILGFWVNLG